jgi:hypothetical protein
MCVVHLRVPMEFHIRSVAQHVQALLQVVLVHGWDVTCFDNGIDVFVDTGELVVEVILRLFIRRLLQHL